MVGNEVAASRETTKKVASLLPLPILTLKVMRKSPLPPFIDGETRGF
jgi:hypothetical protein